MTRTHCLRCGALPERACHVAQLTEDAQTPWRGTTPLQKAAAVVRKTGFTVLADPGRVWGHQTSEQVAQYLDAAEAHVAGIASTTDLRSSLQALYRTVHRGPTGRMSSMGPDFQSIPRTGRAPHDGQSFEDLGQK